MIKLFGLVQAMAIVIFILMMWIIVPILGIILTIFFAIYIIYHMITENEDDSDGSDSHLGI